MWGEQRIAGVMTNADPKKQHLALVLQNLDVCCDLDLHAVPAENDLILQVLPTD